MNSFFRHIFFFTKSQKRGLIVLIVLLILVVVANIQAAPHVAGTIALLRAIKPTLTTEEATALLQNTSTPLSNCDRDSCGTGIINATAAVDELAKQGADPGPDPNPSPGTDDKRTKHHGPGICRSGDPDCRH